MNLILKHDLAQIHQALTVAEKKKLRDSTMLITGCAGFIGSILMQYLAHYREDLGLTRVIGLDVFRKGQPAWVKALAEENGVVIQQFDVVRDSLSDVPGAEQVTHVMHLASIASPVFYRQFPLETMDANVWGLRQLLDFYREKPLQGFAYFSTSEIYGDPPAEAIPTPETYRGHVACIGPRACYDESKRFGETLCYYYHQQYRLPVIIIRPFNNYGPGLSLEDRRITADLAAAVHQNREIILYSDGSPTRTYCYIADAVTGYLKALLYDDFQVFNIGADHPEISVAQLAELYRKIGEALFGYQGQVRYQRAADPQYLSDNPRRRCPDITKAGKMLGFEPATSLEAGIRSHLTYHQYRQEARI